jgi:hypothetical protein
VALGSARSALKADLIEAALGSVFQKSFTDDISFSVVFCRGAKEEDVFLHYEVQIYVVVLSHNC